MPVIIQLEQTSQSFQHCHKTKENFDLQWNKISWRLIGGRMKRDILKNEYIYQNHNIWDYRNIIFVLNMLRKVIVDVKSFLCHFVTNRTV